MAVRVRASAAKWRTFAAGTSEKTAVPVPCSTLLTAPEVAAILADLDPAAIVHDPALPLPDESAEGNPQRRVENRSSMDALSMLLQQLPEHLRECWVLREQMDMSYEQISKTLAIPTATVRGRLARARKTLAEEMKDWR